MKTKQIEIKGEQLTIASRKAPVFIRTVLTLILAILISIPLVVTYFVLTQLGGLHFGVVISYIICWGSGYFILRVILWNSVGREVLTLGRDKISYFADFNLFKDGRREISTIDLQIEILYQDDDDQQFGRLRLRNESDSIDSVVQMTIVDLEEVKNEIGRRYKSA